ncbi:MAG: S9 family peptidase [Gammaproteobacteria bacterium]|nr:S9 family peptidase [Gammaproteobacteria bacterium]
MRIFRLVILLLISQAANVPAAEAPMLEAYGQLPAISQMAISPSGDRIAYRSIADGRDLVLVQDLGNREIIGGIDVSNVNPRFLYFVEEDRVVLVASEARVDRGSRDVLDYSAAFVYDFVNGNLRQLLTRAEEVYPSQTGLGRIVGRSADGKSLYMPAYTGTATRNLSVGLFRVPLVGSNVNLITRGTAATIDWLVDGDGRPLVQEEFDNNSDEYRIWVHDNGKRRLIYEEQTEQPNIAVVGFTPNRDALIVTGYAEDSQFLSYFRMSLQDGSMGEAIFERDDASVEAPLVDLNRVVHGVRYSGFYPSYEFVDKDLDRRVRELQAQNDGTTVFLEGWTPGFTDLLFRFSGGWTSGLYVILRHDEAAPVVVANQRPEIPPDVVSPTSVYEYEARDGMKIPALLTARPDVFAAGDAPLIVMPHGGPQSYDRFGFSWLAQYFSSRGYMVLQPQFRGSSGFGWQLAAAGRGEWGRKMSTDLDDGVLQLVESGMVDGSRVCIVGASYGGYAALAAGAFSDFDYRCIVSIAGVSDLLRSLRESRNRHGRKHWVVAYWEDQFGSEEAERAALDAISPVRHADTFRAPVLLIHGKDDAVVPIAQSTVMQKALKKAKKKVELVRLKGEDHYLSNGETRLESLRAIEKFVQKYLQEAR